jgi:exodeoxyribonuclease VII large subunit
MDNKLILSVSELTRQIKHNLEPLFSNTWVEGEISNMRLPSSGHFYFTLKDSQSQIRAVMFRSQQRMLQFAPEDGLCVICKGRLNVYEPRGEYQILVETMEPKGKGSLQVAFEQLKRKLNEEGLFEPAKKKSLPFLPACVAIITSPTGAAIRDILKITQRRFPNLELLLIPSKVQGSEAPDEIVDALSIINALKMADVIILTRGGGSLEDLWAFNEEKVARAIFASEIPVISAIGHEVDFTIADFVADLRAPTPSAAAEIVVKDKQELIRILSHSVFCLKNALLKDMERKKNSAQYQHSHLKDPQKNIINHRIRLDELHMRVINMVPRIIQQKKVKSDHWKKLIFQFSPHEYVMMNRTKLLYLKKVLLHLITAYKDKKQTTLKIFFEKLNSLSPLGILSRGYSITRVLPSYTIVKKAQDLHKGDTVDIKLSEGNVYCLVEKISP